MRTKKVVCTAVAFSFMTGIYLLLSTDTNNWNKYQFLWKQNLSKSGFALFSSSDSLSYAFLHENDTDIPINCSLIDFPCGQYTLDTNFTMKKRLIEISDIVKVAGTDCAALNNGESKYNARNVSMTQLSDIPVTDLEYVNLTIDCSVFQESRGYIMSSLTKDEEDFPLAYSMVVYKDAEMVERLLRAIYRPQNYYCIHVDAKATDSFSNATSAIADCFPNVFIASRRINVVWALFSVLEPELLCMEELWKYPKWKYFINLTGQEFPLKTNFELVKILTAYRGASDVLTYYKCTARFKWRWNNLKAPVGLLQTVGSVHITASRYFVDFILNNDTANVILNWTKSVHIPDETFFTMLNANPQLGIRGTYTGKQDSCDQRPFITRYKMWPGSPCAGTRVRDICILTIGDLPRLTKTKQLFANKFYLNDDRTVIGCLEEKIFNDTRDEYLRTKIFDTTYYSELDFVKNQIT